MNEWRNEYQQEPVTFVDTLTGKAVRKLGEMAKGHEPFIRGLAQDYKGPRDSQEAFDDAVGWVISEFKALCFGRGRPQAAPSGPMGEPNINPNPAPFRDLDE